MLRITTALIALTLTAGFAQVAPVTTLKADDGLVIKVANDATNENDATDLEEDTLPGGNEPSRAMGAEPNTPGSNNNESMQLEEEKDY
jgi:hypothetical protein